MKKTVLLIALGVIIVSACSTSHKATKNNTELRWPDFLREWAKDYEVLNPQRQAIIDQIDTLYQLVEDSTENTARMCEKLCWVQEAINNAIVYDSSLVFPLMMRATARNFAVTLANDHPSMFEAAFDCDCDVADYIIADTWWYTSSRERFDIMYTTFIGQSWQAPERFANLVLTKGDDSELATALLIVYNYTDTVIDNLRLAFTDSVGNMMEQLTGSDTYIEVLDAGVKQMRLPTYMLMNALVNNWTLILAFDTPQGTLDMVGFPHIHFLEQVEDCPRLKAVLREALVE